MPCRDAYAASVVQFRPVDASAAIVCLGKPGLARQHDNSALHRADRQRPVSLAANRVAVLLAFQVHDERWRFTPFSHICGICSDRIDLGRCYDPALQFANEIELKRTWCGGGRGYKSQTENRVFPTNHPDRLTHVPNVRNGSKADTSEPRPRPRPRV